MDFDWLSLEEDEEVIWEGEPKMNSIIPAIIIGIMLIPIAGLGLFIIAGAYLHIKNTDFLVTSDGVYKKTGIISRRVKKIGFSKIQDISFNQGVFGRKYNYGNVDISTAGGQQVDMRFNSVESPKEVQEIINKRIRSDKEDKEDLSEIEILKTILEEVKSIRKEIEN